MKGSFWLFGAIISCLFISCDNQTEKNKANIIGNWTVVTAFREKRETRLLNEVYFQFGADGKMLTNLPVTTEPRADYSVNNNTIVMQGGNPISFEIVDLADSSAVLSVELRNTLFEIHLKKTVALPTPPEESAPVESPK